MLKRSYCFLYILLIAGCAGPQLRESAIEMGPSFGSLQERQIVQNLGRYLNAPWSIPGQIDITNGTLQIQNQATLSMKLPYPTAGREFDPSLQSQEQDSFLLSPVTDGDDLRRVQALYEYAVCRDVETFRRRWQETITPYKVALAKAKAEDDAKARREVKRTKDASAPGPGVMAAAEALENANRRFVVVSRQIDEGAKTGAADAQIMQRGERGTEAYRDAAARQQALLAARAEQQKLYEELPILQQETVTAMSLNSLKSTAPPATGKDTGGDKTAASAPPDSVELEQAKEDQIARVLGGARFIYWTDAGARTTQRSPCADIPPEQAAPYDDHFYRLGSAAGYDFYTDHPEKVAQFIMFVLGSTPNTSGVHALASNATGNAVPKAQTQPFILLR